jgi:hypothetical protein
VTAAGEGRSRRRPHGRWPPSPRSWSPRAFSSSAPSRASPKSVVARHLAELSSYSTYVPCDSAWLTSVAAALLSLPAVAEQDEAEGHARHAREDPRRYDRHLLPPSHLRSNRLPCWPFRRCLLATLKPKCFRVLNRWTGLVLLHFYSSRLDQPMLVIVVTVPRPLLEGDSTSCCLLPLCLASCHSAAHLR